MPPPSNGGGSKEEGEGEEDWADFSAPPALCDPLPAELATCGSGVSATAQLQLAPLLSSPLACGIIPSQAPSRRPAPQTLSGYSTAVQDVGSFVEQAVAAFNRDYAPYTGFSCSNPGPVSGRRPPGLVAACPLISLSPATGHPSSPARRPASPAPASPPPPGWPCLTPTAAPRAASPWGCVGGAPRGLNGCGRTPAAAQAHVALTPPLQAPRRSAPQAWGTDEGGDGKVDWWSYIDAMCRKK